MLDNLRKKQKSIIWAIAIVFIASMGIAGVVEVFTPRPYVGRIYGRKILFENFDRQLMDNISFHVMQNPDAILDEQTLRNLNDQTWNQLVSRTVMDRQVKRYRIRVRDRDVMDKFRNDPPRELRQNPHFLTDGVWDHQRYLNIVASDLEFAHNLEQYIRMMLPYEILERRIRDQVIVTTDTVRVDWLNRNDRVSGRVILFDWNSIPTQEVSDEEIRAFYNRNRNNYRIEATRRYRFAALPLEASAEDIARAEDDINFVYRLVREGGDFGDLAEHYSECPSAANRGTLNYFGRGAMVPEFEEIAFALNVGEVSEPFQTQFGWHVVKKTGRRVEHGQEEVEASHILVRVEPSDRTRNDLRNLAEDLHARANRVGLERAAAEFGLETRETSDFFRETEHIPGIGNFPTLVSDAFSRRVGFLPEPIRQQDGSSIIAELSFRRNAHVQDLEAVTEAIRREIDREKRIALAQERARDFINTYSEEERFEMAAGYGFRVADFNDIIVTRSIPQIGIDRELNRKLFTMETDEWSPVITTSRNIYVAFVTDRNRPEMEDFYDNLSRLTAELRQRREQTHYSEWYQKVLREANVQDFRFRHY